MWNQPSKERLNQIPKLYETDHIPLRDKMVHLHLFIHACDWYVCEVDGGDYCFGFVILNGDYEMAEWGFFSLSELSEINIRGQEVECEPPEYWEIRPANQINKICHAQRWQTHEKEVTDATRSIQDPEGNLGSNACSREI